jgi:hypothetical protein
LDTDEGPGKKLVNAAARTWDLAQEIGERKSQDYPGADEGLNGEGPEERSRLQGQFRSWDTSGAARDPQGGSGEALAKPGAEENGLDGRDTARPAGE